MVRVIEPFEIPLTLTQWQVVFETGCECGWYRFYHAGCGHGYSPWKHCCGRTVADGTGVPRFCHTPAPSTNVTAFRIEGMCRHCKNEKTSSC